MGLLKGSVQEVLIKGASSVVVYMGLKSDDRFPGKQFGTGEGDSNAVRSLGVSATVWDGAEAYQRFNKVRNAYAHSTGQDPGDVGFVDMMRGVSSLEKGHPVKEMFRDALVRGGAEVGLDAVGWMLHFKRSGKTKDKDALPTQDSPSADGQSEGFWDFLSSIPGKIKGAAKEVQDFGDEHVVEPAKQWGGKKTRDAGATLLFMGGNDIIASGLTWAFGSNKESHKTFERIVDVYDETGRVHADDLIQFVLEAKAEKRRLHPDNMYTDPTRAAITEAVAGALAEEMSRDPQLRPETVVHLIMDGRDMQGHSLGMDPMDALYQVIEDNVPLANPNSLNPEQQIQQQAHLETVARAVLTDFGFIKPSPSLIANLQQAAAPVYDAGFQEPQPPSPPDAMVTDTPPVSPPLVTPQQPEVVVGTPPYVQSQNESPAPAADNVVINNIVHCAEPVAELAHIASRYEQPATTVPGSPSPQEPAQPHGTALPASFSTSGASYPAADFQVEDVTGPGVTENDAVHWQTSVTANNPQPRTPQDIIAEHQPYVDEHRVRAAEHLARANNALQDDRDPATTASMTDRYGSRSQNGASPELSPR